MGEISDTTATRIEIAVDAAERGNRSLAMGVLLGIPAGERLAAMELYKLMLGQLGIAERPATIGA